MITFYVYPQTLIVIKFLQFLIYTQGIVMVMESVFINNHCIL